MQPLWKYELYEFIWNDFIFIQMFTWNSIQAQTNIWFALPNYIYPLYFQLTETKKAKLILLFFYISFTLKCAVYLSLFRNDRIYGLFSSSLFNDRLFTDDELANEHFAAHFLLLKKWASECEMCIFNVEVCLTLLLFQHNREKKHVVHLQWRVVRQSEHRALEVMQWEFEF